MPDAVRVIFRPNPKDVPEIMRRTRLTLGQPFITLPERPEEHEVLLVIDDHKIRRDDVEMVFNDMVLMNFAYALAGYRSGNNDASGSPMAQIRELARRLYGSYGQWVEANYGVVCLECHETLPTHTDNCQAGAKNKRGMTAPADTR